MTDIGVFDDVTREQRSEKARRGANAIRQTHENARVMSADVQVIDAETRPGRSTTPDGDGQTDDDPAAVTSLQQSHTEQSQSNDDER